MPSASAAAVPGLHAHPQDGCRRGRRRAPTCRWLALARRRRSSCSAARWPGAVSDAACGRRRWRRRLRPRPRSFRRLRRRPRRDRAARRSTPPAPSPPMPHARAAPPPARARRAAALRRLATAARPPSPAARPAPAPRAATPRPHPPHAGARTQPRRRAGRARVPWLAELPPACALGLPALAISGAVYSPTPSAACCSSTARCCARASHGRGRDGRAHRSVVERAVGPRPALRAQALSAGTALRSRSASRYSAR